MALLAVCAAAAVEETLNSGLRLPASVSVSPGPNGHPYSECNHYELKAACLGRVQYLRRKRDDIIQAASSLRRELFFRDNALRSQYARFENHNALFRERMAVFEAGLSSYRQKCSRGKLNFANRYRGASTSMNR